MASAEMGRVIAGLLRQPTISVDQAALVLGICRNAAYDAARNGDFDTIRIGKRILVPTAPLRKKLGISDGD